MNEQIEIKGFRMTICFRSLAALIVTVVFASLSWGQCPVTLNFFDSYAIWGAERSLFGGPSTGPRPTMVLKATNLGDKEISAMEFKVAFLDYTLTEHDDWYQAYQWHGHFKQGKDMKARWERAILFDRSNYPYARIRLIKVLYADETLWKNNGTCAEQWDRGYLKTHNKGQNLEEAKQEDEDSEAQEKTQNSNVRTTKTNDPASSVDAKPQTSATATLTATLDVSSTPPNADIEVDGSFIGNTPSSFGLAGGEHKVRINKSGYKPWERTIKASTGVARLVAELEAIPTGYVPAPTASRSGDLGLGIKTGTTDIQ